MRSEVIELTEHAHSPNRSSGGTHESEMVATIADMDAQSFLYLPEVLIKLTAQIGQQIIIDGFQQKFPGFDCGIQEMGTGFVLTIFTGIQAASDSRCNRPRSEFRSASVTSTSTYCPIKRTSA